LALNREKGNLAVHLHLISLGEFPCDHQRIRLRKEDQRVVDNAFVCVLQIVVTQIAVARHVDSENQNAALSWDRGFYLGFDNGYSNADLGDGLDSLEDRFIKTEFAG